MMKTSYYCFVIVLHFLFWVSVISRPFPPNDGVGVQQAGTTQSPESSQLTSPEGLKSNIDEAAKMNEMASYRGFRRIGSSPPSCDNKCYGCTPCEAIQVPTTKKHNAHFKVQYANYEPEGWKCKCGPTFYSP